MNACAPRALTSCNERINDKHTTLVETPARLDRTPFTHTCMRDSGYVLMLFIDTQLLRNAVGISMPRSNSAVSKERWGKKHNFQNHFFRCSLKLNTNRKEMLDVRVGQCVETS